MKRCHVQGVNTDPVKQFEKQRGGDSSGVKKNVNKGQKCDDISVILWLFSIILLDAK